MSDEELVREFVVAIRAARGDYERQHIDGDEFIVKALREHGLPKLAAEFERRTKDWWYA